MSPAHVEAGRSIKNAVANKAILPRPQKATALDPTFCGRDYGRACPPPARSCLAMAGGSLSLRRGGRDNRVNPWPRPDL
jgi:hypothetical protein